MKTIETIYSMRPGESPACYPATLPALFKRLTGHAPIDFFIHLRMHRACVLLDSTWLRVKEVAAALGYDDPFYFSVYSNP
jgi:AraC-like DNA-binding protein